MGKKRSRFADLESQVRDLGFEIFATKGYSEASKSEKAVPLDHSFGSLNLDGLSVWGDANF